MPRGFQAEEGARSLAQSGVNAALGLASRERRRVETSRGGGVSILGAGRQTILVRVANLAQGTTAEDVVVSRVARAAALVLTGIIFKYKLTTVRVRPYAIYKCIPIPLYIIQPRIGRSGSIESKRRK